MQFNNSVEMISDWTNDTKATAMSLKSKISSGKRARFAEAVAAAAQALSTRPEGSRHVVLVTDGVDTGGKIDRSDAVKQLMEARATVHVVSYTEFVRQKKDNTPGGMRGGQLPSSADPITSTDPTLPPGVTRSPSFGVGLRFDPEMRRRRQAYEASVKKSQQILTQMAAETGGQIFLPKSGDEMIAQARTVAKQIGAEYVLTYRPKRPLAQARAGEYRRVEVASRRVGLSVSSRRGYIVPAQ
jgi:VWFA-related protein